MSKIVIKSFEEVNKERKRNRIILLIVSLPLMVIISLFGVKVFSMYANVSSVITKFEEEKFEAASHDAVEQKNANFFEPWLAPYNLGTTYAADGVYDLAEEELLDALELTMDSLNQCFVRSNLSLTYEANGDLLKSQDKHKEADKKYALALKVISEAPPECFPPSEGGSGDEDSESSEAGKNMAETEERVEGKEGGDEPEDAQPEEEEGEGETPEETPEDKIKDQLEQSNIDRTTQENSERNSGMPQAPKPW